jgi:hypothetical protein
MRQSNDEGSKTIVGGGFIELAELRRETEMTRAFLDKLKVGKIDLLR